VVATAVGRVAVIVGLAAAAAQEMVARPPGSGLGGRVRPGLLAPSALWPLHLVAALADPAAVVVEQCAGMGRPYVLDDVGPLLGDENAPLWERRLGQLRLAVHALGQPGHGPGRDLLAALADFGLAVSVQAGRTAGRVADHGPRSTAACLAPPGSGRLTRPRPGGQCGPSCVTCDRWVARARG